MIRRGKAPPAALKRQLATKAFAHTAAYDAQIASYLSRRVQDAAAAYPERLVRAWQRKALLRYGENPHQSAALYVDPTDVEAIAQAMLRLSQDETLREELIEAGYRNVQRFSWEKAATETLAVLEEAARQGR